MAEYTFKNIIIDPNSEKAKDAVGKEVYYSDNPSYCIEFANEDDEMFLGTLKSVEPNNKIGHFYIKEKGRCYDCIIVKKEPSYKDQAKQWIEENNLEVGDYVKVLRKTELYENKWGSLWNDSMTDYIGKALKVLAINSLRGLISLECDDAVYDFPYFVLEKAEKPESQYVPFESKEEFIEAYHYHDNAKYSETDDILMNYGMWLWSNVDGSYKLVTEIWNAGVVIGDDKMRITNEEGHIDVFNDTTSWVKLFSEYRFLDGSHCGKEVKDE